MSDINYRIAAKACAATTSQILTNNGGLSSWWVGDRTGADSAGSIFQFRVHLLMPQP